MFYGLLTGVSIAAYTIVDGYAVKFVLMSPILLDYYGNFVRLLFLLPTVLRDRATTADHWRKQWKYAVAVAAIRPISYVLVLYAMKAAPLSHVAPAREVSMLFAALIGGQLPRRARPSGTNRWRGPHRVRRHGARAWSRTDAHPVSAISSIDRG